MLNYNFNIWELAGHVSRSFYPYKKTTRPALHPRKRPKALYLTRMFKVAISLTRSSNVFNSLDRSGLARDEVKLPV